MNAGSRGHHLFGTYYVPAASNLSSHLIIATTLGTDCYLICIGEETNDKKTQLVYQSLMASKRQMPLLPATQL